VNQAVPTENISLAEFQANMVQLVTIASRLAAEVIILGLLPVDEAKTTPFKEQKYYTVAQLAAYNEVLAEIARDKKLRFVNFFPDWQQRSLPELFADGLHPNTLGHQLMFEQIKRQLFTS